MTFSDSHRARNRRIPRPQSAAARQAPGPAEEEGSTSKEYAPLDEDKGQQPGLPQVQEGKFSVTAAGCKPTGS